MLQEIKGICYDIITPRCMEDFRHDTWYDVKEGVQSQNTLQHACLPNTGVVMSGGPCVTCC